MRPPLPIEWDGSSLGKLNLSTTQVHPTSKALAQPFMDLYLNGIKNKTSVGTQVFLDCTRRDNGFQASETCREQLDGHGKNPNGLVSSYTEVREVETLFQDRQKGITFFRALIDYPGTASQPQKETEKVPGTYLVLQLIKFNDEYIEKIEGFVKWFPFGYKSSEIKQ